MPENVIKPKHVTSNRIQSWSDWVSESFRTGTIEDEYATTIVMAIYFAYLVANSIAGFYLAFIKAKKIDNTKKMSNECIDLLKEMQKGFDVADEYNENNLKPIIKEIDTISEKEDGVKAINDELKERYRQLRSIDVEVKEIEKKLAEINSKKGSGNTSGNTSGEPSETLIS